jgi:hypothetical protein
VTINKEEKAIWCEGECVLPKFHFGSVMSHGPIIKDLFQILKCKQQMIKHNFNLHKLTNNLTQIVSNKKYMYPLNTSPRKKPLLKREETNKHSFNVDNVRNIVWESWSHSLKSQTHPFSIHSCVNYEL